MRTAQASVFLTRLTRSRINYQFTRALSLRMIVDDNAVLENAALIDLKRQEPDHRRRAVGLPDPSGNSALRGVHGPLENLGLFNGTVRPIGFPSTTTARQFFAKVSYLFRF
jgi:hypothetical protein